MSKLQVTFAVQRYDHLDPLIGRTVQPESIELRIVHVPTETRHAGMYRHQEYDACEFGLGPHLVAASRGELLGQAIPAFPLRKFPHKYWVVRTDRNIHSPEDLIGRRVGIVCYENTLQVPVRSALEYQYGVHRKQIHWVAGYRGLVGIDHVDDVPLEVLDGDGRQSLEKMLLAGELDAMVVPRILDSIVTGDPRVRDLFSDAKSEEKAYFAFTGDFPLMHVVLLKKSLVERHPWVAENLLDALVRSRRQYLERRERHPTSSFAWGRELLLEERRFFGRNQWDDGFKANRKQLELMCGYAHEQGMTADKVDPTALFVPSTLDS